MPSVVPTQSSDDDRSRVTRWTFSEPGDATGSHVHEFDYIVVPVTGGDLTVVAADGTVRAMSQRAGVPYVGTAGTSHNVISHGSESIVFVEVELKSRPSP